MKDIIISVDSTSHKVNFPDEFLGIGYENLQGNLIFQFDNNFIGGQARLDISIDCESGMIPNLTPYENGYILPIKSSLLTGSNVLMQLVIDETSLTQYSLTTDTEINPNKTYYEKVGNDYIVVENPVVSDISQYYEANTPVFKTDIFQLKVKDSINAQETIPEQYPTWINTLNTLIGTINQKLGLVDIALTEMNNLNINVSDKVDGEVTITFTDKQGNQKEVKINDGRGIVSILKTATSGNIDTYTITYTDDTTSTFEVTNGIDGTDGRGIVSIEKTETTGLIDTYTITYTDNTTSTFYVANGRGITNIEKISTNLLVDTYRISFNDGTTQDYEVTNGKGIVSIEKTSTEGLTDIYTITYNDETTATFNVVNGKGIVSIEKTSTSGYVDTYTINYNDGTTSTYEVTNGEVSQAQLDALQDELNYYKTIVNALPKITGSGTSITLNNTADSILSNVLNPSELSQDGTPTPETPYEIHTISGDNTIEVVGKNLLPNNGVAQTTINGITFTANVDGTILVSGTASATAYLTYPTFSLNAGTYTLSAGAYVNTLTRIQLVEDTSGRPLLASTQNASSQTFTTTATKNVFLQFRVNSGEVINTTFKPMLVKGSYSSSNIPEYEPYQEQIAQLNLGDLEYGAINDYKDKFIRSSGKQLLNIPDMTITNNGLTLTFTNGIGKITGTWASATYLVVDNLDLVLSPNTYTLSTNSNITSYPYFYLYSGDTAVVSMLSSDNNVKTFTISENTPITKISIYFGANRDYKEIKPMLNTGSTALDYEPYGNYWYLKKNARHLSLAIADMDNSEDYPGWKNVSDLLNDYPNKNTLLNNFTDYMCNITNNDNVISVNTVFLAGGGTLFFNRGAIDLTQTQWKEQYPNLVVELYYGLQNPEYLPLNDTLQEQLETIYNLLKSYKGQTNISQINNDLPFIIDSTALKDLTSL